MKPVDTHAHFQFQAFDEDRQRAISENLKELTAVMVVGASLDSSEKAVKLVQDYPQLFAAVGVHPHHVNQWSEKTLLRLADLAKKKKVVAIGEIGLDKHPYQGYPTPNISEQKKILLPQMDLARGNSLPILFHCREAYEELLSVLEETKPHKGLMHCFMGDKSLAKKFLDLGLFISFSGNITYNGNDHIREAAKYVPLDRILVETDSPYLTPIPYRGQRNEPKYVKIVLETISSLKNLSLERVAQATTKNALSLLGLEIEV